MGVFAGCLSDEPESIERWLLDAENYEGTIEDKTGTKSVAVTVGPEKEATSVPSPTSGNETHQQSSTENEYTFAPAAIKISPETTVTWKWEGRGNHNVVATDGEFHSGEPQAGATFTHTFESAGTNYYYCEPHKGRMKGVVVVAESAPPEGTTRQ